VALQMARLIGSAGSGKTTELIKIMEGALPGVGGNPHAIGLLSFTTSGTAGSSGAGSVGMAGSGGIADP